jgi:hypothetical protein
MKASMAPWSCARAPHAADEVRRGGLDRGAIGVGLARLGEQLAHVVGFVAHSMRR